MEELKSQLKDLREMLDSHLLDEESYNELRTSLVSNAEIFFFSSTHF